MRIIFDQATPVPIRPCLRARTVVLPRENREEFDQLSNALEAEWQPHTPTEHFYLEQMAISQWKLTRVEVAEVDMFQETASAVDQIPLLDRLSQYQCRLERSFTRAQRELQRLQASRPAIIAQPAEPVPPPVNPNRSNRSIQHPTSNIQHPTSNNPLLYWMQTETPPGVEILWPELTSR